MQLLIYLVAGILVTTTECTIIQNCPTGSLTVEKDADDFSLICVGYTGTIVWEYKTPESSKTTIGQCHSTCTLDMQVLSRFFTLTEKSASSSELTLTKAFTETVDSYIFTCELMECSVSVESTSIQNCPTGSLTVEKDADDYSLICVGYTGTIVWEYKTPESSKATIGRCDSTCTLDMQVLSHLFTLTEKSASSSELTLTKAFTGTVDSYIFTCELMECSVSVERLTTVPPTTTGLTTVPPTATGTSIQNCPTGSLIVEKDADDFSLTCVGYTGTIVWEYKTPESSKTTIARCDSTCTLDMQALSHLFTLAETSASSSELTLTTAFTETVHSYIFTCDRMECSVSVERLTTVPPPTTEPSAMSDGLKWLK